MGRTIVDGRTDVDVNDPRAVMLTSDRSTDEAGRPAEAGRSGGVGTPEGIEPSLAELPGLLARSASGFAFIYQALDLLLSRYGLDEIAVVVDGSALGRQVFRRRRVQGGRHSSLLSARLRNAPVGLHAEPAVVDRVTAVYLTHLVDVAVRWDLARRDAGLDALTGLYNRRLYEVSIEQAMARSRRYGWPFAIVLLDMDDFKAVNDRLGHAGGDAALRIVGSELRSSLRAGDLAARMGGDEFALLVLNTDSPEAIGRLSERLEAALHRSALGIELRFSAGVACFPVDGGDLATLMQVADQRLYAAKAVRD